MTPIVFTLPIREFTGTESNPLYLRLLGRRITINSMKIRITMKDPDCVYEAVEEALKDL